MGKFSKLVKNEYIKNLKRTSTIVMLILIVAAGFVCPGIVKIASELNDTVYYGDDSTDLVAYHKEIVEGLEKRDSTSGITAEEVITLEESKLIVAYNISNDSDWRYNLILENLDNLIEMGYDEEFYEQVLAEEFEKIDPNLTEAEITALQYKAYDIADSIATKKAAETVKKHPQYAAILNILESNDLKVFYDTQIKMFEAEKLLAATDAEKAIVQAKIDHFTYLRDNDVYYHGKLDELDVSMTESNYDSRYFDSYNRMMSTVAVIGYENGIGNVSRNEYSKAKDIVTLSDYMLENDVTYNVADSVDPNESYVIDFWTSMGMSTSAVSFIGLLIIVIAALSVANEFSNGTIKFLLINPVKRWKILVSKYFTVISMGYIMLILLFIVSTIVSLIFFGGSLIGESMYEVVDGEVVATFGLLKVFKSYLVNSIEVVVMATLAFAISTLMRSSAFAIGISMLCMLGGNVVVSILSAMKLDWARYLIFANLDLESIAKGSSSFAYQSVNTAIGVIAVHMVIFWLIAWDAFTKKDL